MRKCSLCGRDIPGVAHVEIVKGERITYCRICNDGKRFIDEHPELAKKLLDERSK